MPPHRLTSLLTCAWVLALTVDPRSQATSVRDPCDAKLIRPAADPLAYASRGDRCEGIYVREVAGTGGISVVAFTNVAQLPEIRSGAPLHLQWPQSVRGPVNVRAVSLRRGLYYRMDTTRPAGASQFDWPTDILVGLNLKREEVGLVAWIQGPIGQRIEDIYVPLRIAEPSASQRNEGPVALVLPGMQLDDLFVTLTPVNASGEEQAPLVRNQSLNRGFYPSERVVPVPLPKLPAAGLYRLQLNAILAQGAPSPRSLYFQYAVE